MKTALDLANRSLKLVLVEAADSPLEPDEYQDYYDALNDFMFDLEESGVRLGYREVTGPADVVTVPRGAIRGIVANMAIEVAPDYGGKITAPLIASAKTGMETLRLLGQKPIRASLPTGLPRGTGSESYPFRNLSHYEPTPDGIMSMIGNTVATPITAASTAVLVSGEWDTPGMEMLSADVAGRIKNAADRSFLLDVRVNLTATAGSAVTGTFTLMRNGAEAVTTVVVALSATRADGYMQSSLTLAPGEYLELWVENGTDTENITVADAIIEVA